MTQSGKLDKKIKIFKKIPIKDEEGFQSFEKQILHRPWAFVKGNTEPVQVDGEKETVTKERVTFEIYYRPGIDTTMSVEFRGKDYEITAIYNPGFNDEMLILTGERKNSRGRRNGQW